jgi:uncharacterized protein
MKPNPIKVDWIKGNQCLVWICCLQSSQRMDWIFAMDDLTQRRKLLSALSHAAIFFSSLVISIGIPIAILFTSDDPVIKDNAKESINFHFNIFIYAAVFFLLIFVFIGYPLLILLGIATFVLPIMAIVHCVSVPNKPYRYPLIYRLLK